MSAQSGLKWETTLFGSHPQWTVEPSIDIVTKVACHVLRTAADNSDVKFLGQGAFNKTYLITTRQGDYVMRVALPVDPRFKTLSEVAVLEYLQKVTPIPIPEIFGFDASRRNDLGFEWILMNRVPGRPLNLSWDSMSWPKKCRVVEQVVEIMANLFRTRFPLIGNIYRSQDLHHSTSQSSSRTLAGKSNFVVDRIVSMPFFWDQRLQQNVSRGPFQSSIGWMKSRLAMAMNDCKNVLTHQEDKGELEDAEATKSLILRLSPYMSKVFPPGSEEGQFAIHHDDISEGNLLVCADDGKIQALIDWECVSCLPLWKSCQFPVFLWGRDRHEQPQLELYAKNEDGSTNEIFTEHLKEYEKTLLRKVFLDRMARTEPQWIQIFESSTRKADFDLALDQCDSSLMLMTIKKWLDSIDAGKEYQSLHQLILK